MPSTGIFANMLSSPATFHRHSKIMGALGEGTWGGEIQSHFPVTLEIFPFFEDFFFCLFIFYILFFFIFDKTPCPYPGHSIPPHTVPSSSCKQQLLSDMLTMTTHLKRSSDTLANSLRNRFFVQLLKNSILL